MILNLINDLGNHSLLSYITSIIKKDELDIYFIYCKYTHPHDLLTRNSVNSSNALHHHLILPVLLNKHCHENNIRKNFLQRKLDTTMWLAATMVTIHKDSSMH